jgi:hypothetical protein
MTVLKRLKGKKTRYTYINIFYLEETEIKDQEIKNMLLILIRNTQRKNFRKRSVSSYGTFFFTNDAEDLRLPKEFGTRNWKIIRVRFQVEEFGKYYTHF